MIPASPYTCSPDAVPSTNSSSSSSAAPHALRFLELSRAFMVSRTFTTAVKLDLFTKLQDLAQAAATSDDSALQSGTQGVTAACLGQLLGFRSESGFRGTADFLDTLVSLDVLLRSTGEHGSTLYSNTPAAAKYLSRTSPDYIGGIAIVNHDRSYPQFLFLEAALKEGQLPPAADQLVQPVVETFSGGGPGGLAATQDFALGMTGANAEAFRRLAQQFDWSQYTTLGDIGGSAGALCCAVVSAQQHIRAVTHDLPAVHAAAVAHVQQQGLSDRVQIQDLDFFAAERFPTYDVITMSMILHDWGVEKKEQLIAKAFAALPPGGAFIALDVIIDDQRCANVWGLTMALNMLLEFGKENAGDYTFQEFDAWTRAAGFQHTELLHLFGPNSAAVAYK